MRIVSGRWKGTQLATPGDARVRPTSDRVRESLFNVLTHGHGVPFNGLRVLDLFAGTGALGLEALSRGAAFVLFVEQSAEARGLIRRNVEKLGATGVTKIYRRDATQLSSPGSLSPFDLVFLDPPYRQGFAEPALASAGAEGWLVSGALAVVEEAADVEITPAAGWHEREARRYGDTGIWILQWGDEATEPGDGLN